MSSNYNFDGVLQPGIPVAVTTGGVYVASPTGKALHRLVGIRICNIDTANTCRLKLYTYDGSTDSQYFQDIIAADDSVIIDDPHVFGTQEKVRKIKAVAEANSRLIATAYFVIATPSAVKAA